MSKQKEMRLAREQERLQLNAYHQEREFLHELRGAACAQVGVDFGPVRLGQGCREEATGATATGQPMAWMMTANRDAVVPQVLRAPIYWH